MFLLISESNQLIQNPKLLNERRLTHILTPPVMWAGEMAQARQTVLELDGEETTMWRSIYRIILTGSNLCLKESKCLN